MIAQRSSFERDAELVPPLLLLAWHSLIGYELADERRVVGGVAYVPRSKMAMSTLKADHELAGFINSQVRAPSRCEDKARPPKRLPRRGLAALSPSTGRNMSLSASRVDERIELSQRVDLGL